MPEQTDIPTFALYGEDAWQSPAGFGHVETIAERSALHDWTIAPHRHDRAVQLLIVRDGRADVTLDGTLFSLTEASFIVVPVSVVHGFRFLPGTTGHVLTLSQEFVGRTVGTDDPLRALLTRGGFGAIPPAAIDRIDWLCAELLNQLHGEAVTARLFDALAEAVARSLAAESAALQEDRRLALFRHLVETHLTEHRQLDFYASSIGITTRTLGRLCRAHLGTAPQTLINRRLALEAQRLLAYTSKSATQVAAELGFSDPSYFSRFYLRMTGRRPQAVRGGRVALPAPSPGDPPARISIPAPSA